MLADSFGPAAAIVIGEPEAVGFVEIEGNTAEWVIGSNWHLGLHAHCFLANPNLTITRGVGAKQDEFVQPRIMRHLAAFIQPVPELLAREAGDGEAKADFLVEGALEEWEPCEGGRAISH